MEINQQLLDKLAHLSRLEFDKANAETMIRDLNAIVAWVDKLKEVNTEGVEPLTSMTEEVNVLRPDKAETPLPHDQAMALGPKTKDGYFLVPKILE